MKSRGLALLATLALAGSSTACGLDSSYALPFDDIQPGSIQPMPELADVDVTVGSKEFTEALILGYIAEIALTAAGADVTDLTNIQGSNSARYALRSGDIDLYWDYTGTGWITHLGETRPIPDEKQQFDAVRAADVNNGVEWLDYSPVNNTYAFTTTKEFSEANGIKSISDIANLVRKEPSKGTFCLETEFISRQDGMPGVSKTYGLEVPPANVKNFGSGAIYAAVENGTCNFGEVYTTDGRIVALDLALIEDDKKFFPQYNASITIRKEFLDAHPQFRQVLEPIGKKLDNPTMQVLNAQVDVDGKDPAVVARDWMAKEGFIAVATGS